MIVKVLGAGCSKCKLLVKRLEEIKQQNQLDFDLEYITQLEDIMSYGIMMTPGLIINDELKTVGKVPSDSQLLDWIKVS